MRHEQIEFYLRGIWQGRANVPFGPKGNRVICIFGLAEMTFGHIDGRQFVGDSESANAISRRLHSLSQLDTQRNTAPQLNKLRGRLIHRRINDEVHPLFGQLLNDPVNCTFGIVGKVDILLAPCGEQFNSKAISISLHSVIVHACLGRQNNHVVLIHRLIVASVRTGLRNQINTLSSGTFAESICQKSRSAGTLAKNKHADLLRFALLLPR